MNIAASSILRVMGIGGRASSAAWWYRPSGTARQSRILMTQVSVSVRMARPNPCRNFFCISGTTTAWMYSCNVAYCSFSASLNGSGTGNGSRAQINEDTISPGKSTPLPAGSGGEQHRISHLLELPDDALGVPPDRQQRKREPVLELMVHRAHQRVGREQGQGVPEGGANQPEDLSGQILHLQIAAHADTGRQLRQVEQAVFFVVEGGTCPKAYT